MTGIDILAIILIAVFFAALVFYGYSLGKVALQGTVGRIALAFASTLGVLFIVYLFLNIGSITPADWAQILLLFGLVGVTGFYALSATKQARDTAKMADEMKEQRYDAVRPVIDINRDPADEDKMLEAIAAREGDPSKGLACVLHNIGLGPAIDLYSFIQNPVSGKSERYDFGTLAKGEKTSRMRLSMINEMNKDHPSDLLLITLYRDIYDRKFFSSRNVSIDKEKGWELAPLFTHPTKED